MDLPLLVITIILLGVGLIMLYSASYVKGLYERGDSLHYIKDQALYAAAGLGIMMFVSKWDYHIWRRYTLLILGITYILLVLVFFMPEINYANRWIFIPGGPTFQPSEIAKFTVILIFADWIQRFGTQKMRTFKYGLLPFLILLGSIAGLVIVEPHISATLIICAIGAIMMWIGGTNEKFFFLGVLLVVLAVVMAYFLNPAGLWDRAMSRITAWQNPESDLRGSGYQSYQSLLAIGSGGLFGLGLGNSRQKHLHLPEPQNDFIFAVICEELGFIGGMLVICLFLALLLRGMYIAFRAKDKFGAMLVVGVISQITIQAFLNIAVATNTIPNTGISLPFFSEGGTSLLMLLGEMGIVLSVSRYANLEKGE
ncbi:MAG: cell division protein FtsW [Oscillospiraceae bacterium]|nr:cell division protein FtsW [Oscillospiraceae bacterium]